MNKFIVAKLSGRDEFRTSLECNLSGVRIKYQNLKIDTGAVKSLLPLRTINFSSYFDLSALNSVDSFYRCYKQELIRNGCKIRYMRGVTNKKEYDAEVNILNRDDITFECAVADVLVGDYFIAQKLNFNISCDTHGNVLLGMDVLKHFDYHCGNSIISDMKNNINKGDHIFLGCLNEKVNDDYLWALKYYLGYMPDDKRIAMLMENDNINLKNWARWRI